MMRASSLNAECLVVHALVQHAKRALKRLFEVLHVIRSLMVVRHGSGRPLRTSVLDVSSPP